MIVISFSFGRIAWGMLVTAILSLPAQAADAPSVAQMKSIGETISVLKWDTRELPLQRNETSGIPFVVISGALDPTWTLLDGRDFTVIEVSSDGKFNYQVLLPSDVVRLPVNAVNPLGEVEIEEIEIVSPTPVPAPTPISTPPSTSFVRFPKPIVSKTGGLGFSSLLFRQSGLRDLVATLLTGRASYTRPIYDSRWSLGANGYVTLSQVLSSHSEVTARFLGGNLRVGYALPYLKRPWELTLMVGYYYATMIGPRNKFGYAHLSGPQIYPAIRYDLEDAGDISAYIKFSPISFGIELLPLANREIAVGAAWTIPLSADMAFVTSLDVAQLALKDLNAPALYSNTLTLSSGLAW